ncbi:spore germination protein GerPE [Chengkuizengella axinellae]|uniref:Spore germination protein GerPE n=1 Tax=Chengkuizengella axinellae TaxID=3064388 RepID=A0ABT9IT44_9BACL|nr:spore germination protein GerPE [Chengkuizengella sp. 2205SS18-9]MDP5272508.1 spore germination protein GerPE [Chengkuizengella sp. 2205SS18-9]
MRRTSVVERIKVISVTRSAIFQIGDSVNLKPRSLVYAVQRGVPVYFPYEGDFAQQELFKEPIPKLVVKEDVKTTFINENPNIYVDSIRILGMGGSSVLQVGSNCEIDTESKVINIRQFIKEDLESHAYMIPTSKKV